MKVVHRGARTLRIERPVTEAPALAKGWGGRGANTLARGCVATHDPEASRADPQRNQAILGRIPAGGRRRADDLAGAAVFLAFPASNHGRGPVRPVDRGRPGP